MTPWIFLAVSVIGALLTLNTFVGQRDTGPVVLPSFLLGWLFAELPLHTIGWQVVATAIFAAAGAFESAPGFWGLALCVVSWAALFAHDILITAEDFATRKRTKFRLREVVSDPTKWPVVTGGFPQEGFLAADGDEKIVINLSLIHI